MRITPLIHEKLTDRLAPTILDIIDESDLHKGHKHHNPDGESHFRITIVSDKFVSLSSVQRHRLVYDILKDELNTKIHALSLITKTSGEL